MAHTPKHARKQAKKAAKQERRTQRRERRATQRGERRARRLAARRASGDISFKDALRMLAPGLLDDFEARTQRGEDIFGQIQPLAQMFIDFAMDPAKFLQSPQGQALLAPLQEATSANFQGARQNQLNLLGATGFSPQSGVGAGPLAALGGQEAEAQSRNTQQLIAQALGLGVQGAGLLGQQQAFFDPNRSPIFQAAQTRFGAPPGVGLQLALAAAGGAGQAISGFAGGGAGGASSLTGVTGASPNTIPTPPMGGLFPPPLP